MLQYLLDLNILFIFEKLRLILWNPKTEIPKGLNEIEINEKENLFVLESFCLIYKVSNQKL